MGCCENNHTIQASEEYIREKIMNLKLKSITYDEMYKLVDSYAISGKIPKKIVQKSILIREHIGLSDISKFEENLFEFIINHYSNSMTTYECLYYMFIFLNHGNNINTCNKNLYNLFFNLLKGKLTISTLEKGLYDYLYFSTFKVNFFFESNLNEVAKDYHDEIQGLNKNLFNNNNIKRIVKILISKFMQEEANISENTIIEEQLFSKCLQEVNLSSIVEVRDMFYATFTY
jgi:hypothetical protein